MKASNKTTQNNENTPKNVDVLSHFRKHNTGIVSFWDILAHLTFIGLIGANEKMVYCDVIDGELIRKPKYYYKSDTINVLFYKMDLPITNRDYFIKTILMRNFDMNPETLKMMRFYDNTKATLFVSSEQLNKKNIKFTQVGINEDNNKHKYKTFAELLATIRTIIEHSVGSTVWIYIDPVTLLPTIDVCEYDNDIRKWSFVNELTNFETNVSIGYLGVNMYNIKSGDTVDIVKERYYEFMNMVNESISSQVNETVHTLPENKQMINFFGDKIVIDNRFCFYYTISHKTISPLIRYLINYLEIDIPAFVSGNIKIKHEAVDTYLKNVFKKNNPIVPGQTLNKEWKCDFGVITDSIMLEDNRDKTMLLNCISSLSFDMLNSFNLVSYLYAKGYPDILLDFVLSRHRSGTYRNTIGLINIYNLLYDIISFDSVFIFNLEVNREFKTWYLILHLYSDNYREQLIEKIKSSYYIKLIMLSMGALKYCTKSRVETVFDTMLFSQQEMTFEEAYKLEYPRLVGNNEYWTMTLDLLRLIGPDFTNDELRLNKKLLFKMIDKECEC